MLLGPATALALFATPIAASWAGRAIINPTGSVRKVTGTFVVPHVSIPAGGSSTAKYTSSIWVGIDGTGSGSSCSLSQLAQTGVSLWVQGSSTGCSPWYEWYPANDITFPTSEVTCAFGDTITATIEATSSTTAVATIENVSTGKTGSVTFSSSSHPLCQVDAEWVVENYRSNGQSTQLADFGSVTFTNAIATLENGTTIAVSTPKSSQAYSFNVKDASGTPETSWTASGSSITIDYIY